MRRILSTVILLCLGVFLVGCNKANRYDFAYELSVHNYEELIDIDFEFIDGTRYVKYELKEEGFLESLILTIETIYSPTRKTEQNITLTEEGTLYEIKKDDSYMGLSTSVIGCLGTLYTNQFESVYGFSLNKGKSDVKDLNESLEVFNQQSFYTAEYTMKVMDISLKSKIGFRNNPFYFYMWTPFDKTAYEYQESSQTFVKKYRDANQNTISYLSVAEMIEELGITESSSFLFFEDAAVYKENENTFHIIGVLKDLLGGFFPEGTFEDISEYSEFVMSIEIISEDEMHIDFDILNDDIEYEFSFVYDFASFGDIDYLFE